MNLNKHRGKNDFFCVWISKVHLGRSNMWPFCRKCRERWFVLTSGRITWRQCCFLSILLNNVWSASSAKSRNENNWEHKPYFNAHLRKELIRPICSKIWCWFRLVCLLTSEFLITSSSCFISDVFNVLFCWAFWSCWLGNTNGMYLIGVGCKFNENISCLQTALSAIADWMTSNLLLQQC